MRDAIERAAKRLCILHPELGRDAVKIITEELQEPLDHLFSDWTKTNSALIALAKQRDQALAILSSHDNWATIAEDADADIPEMPS